MNKMIKLLSISLVLCLVFLGCSKDDEQSSEGNANKETEEQNETDKEQNEKPYHEIGESFEFTTFYSEELLEVTVNKIWMEDGKEHEQYINDQDNATVTFIEYTVTNNGSSPITYNDIIPQYVGDGSSGDEIDLSYPENDEIKDYYDAFDLELEPGATEEIIGAVATTTYSENVGAYIWNYTADLPEVVFQTPQSERRDAIGVYDIGEEIYLLDQTEDNQLTVTIDDIKTENETEFEKLMDDSVWVVFDMDVKNKGKETQDISITFPEFVIDNKPQTHGNTCLKLNGEIIEDPWNDREAYLDSGAEVQAELFIEIDKITAENGAQISYFDSEFLRHHDFAKKINYNLQSNN